MFFLKLFATDFSLSDVFVYFSVTILAFIAVRGGLRSLCHFLFHFFNEHIFVYFEYIFFVNKTIFYIYFKKQ